MPSQLIGEGEGEHNKGILGTVGEATI